MEALGRGVLEPDFFCKTPENLAKSSSPDHSTGRNLTPWLPDSVQLPSPAKRPKIIARPHPSLIAFYMPKERSFTPALC
jgi:hypothetical protein